MSKRYSHGSHYENHKRAAELHDLGAHAHRTAVMAHDKQVRIPGDADQHSGLMMIAIPR
jgi:hypothetical protein